MSDRAIILFVSAIIFSAGFIFGYFAATPHSSCPELLEITRQSNAACNRDFHQLAEDIPAMCRGAR